MKDNLQRSITPPMLINELARLFDASMRELGTERNVCGNAGRFLMMLLSDNGALTPGDIAKRTGMKASTISVAASKLEAAEYIEREPSGEDGRSVRFTLTEKGKAATLDTRNALDICDARMMEHITPEERECLITLLERMRENMQKEVNTHQ